MFTLGFAFDLLTNCGSMPRNVLQKGRVGMFECVCAWPRGIETYRECVRTPFLTHTGILTFKYTETKRRALPLTNTWRDANSYTCRDTNTLSSSLTIALKLSSKRYYKWLVYQTILLLAKINTVLKVLPFKRLWAKHTSQQPFIQVSNLSFKSTPIIPCERRNIIFFLMLWTATDF